MIGRFFPGFLFLLICGTGSSPALACNDPFGGDKCSVTSDQPAYSHDEAARITYVFQPKDEELNSGHVNLRIGFPTQEDQEKAGKDWTGQAIGTGGGNITLPLSNVILDGTPAYSLARFGLDYSKDGQQAFSDSVHEGSFHVWREVRPPTGLHLRIENKRIRVGEPVRITIQQNALKSTVAPYTNWKRTDIAALSLVQMPREVPGGGWIPAQQLAYAEVTRDKSSYTLWPVSGEKPGSFNMGLLPPGKYSLYLTRDGIVLDEIQAIEIYVPAPNDHDFISLSPDKKPEKKAALPVYDEIPALSFQVPSGLHALAKHGVLRLYRVGRHDRLRLINEYEVECNGNACAFGAGQVNADFAMRMPHHSSSSMQVRAGTYELRFYWRRGESNIAYDHLDYVLSTKRYIISEKAAAKTPALENWEDRAEPLPPDAFKLAVEGNGPFHAGQVVNIRVTTTKDGKTDPWDEAVATDLWVSLHYKSGYIAGCAQFEENRAGQPLLLRKAKPVALNLPPGAIVPPPLPTGPVIMNAPQPLTANGQPPATSHNAVLASGADGRRVSITLPHMPGTYEVRLYRGDFAGGAGQRMPDAELLAFAQISAEIHKAGSVGFAATPAARQSAQIDARYTPASTQSTFHSVAIIQPRLRYAGGGKSALDQMRIGNQNGLTGPVPNRPGIAMPADGLPEFYAQAHLTHNGVIIASSAPQKVAPAPDAENPLPQSLWPEPVNDDALIVPVADWLLPDDACANVPVPEHKLRLVEWIAPEHGEVLEYDRLDHLAVNTEKDEYKKIKAPWLGYPFFIEAEFNSPPDAPEYVGRVDGKTRVIFRRTEDNPAIYRSVDMYAVTENGLEKAQ